MPSEVTTQTVRAGIYARYSSDSQRDASIDDQIRICRAEIERKGCNLIQVYADGAISAASTLHPGDQKLLQDASAGAIDVVVAENLDRSSRVTKRMSPPSSAPQPAAAGDPSSAFSKITPRRSRLGRLCDVPL